MINHGIVAEIQTAFGTIYRYRPNDNYKIYHRLNKLTKHIAEKQRHWDCENAASWCESATVGEVYDLPHDNIKITIRDLNTL